MAEGMRVEPDLNFIKFLKTAGGDTLKKCFQCATCSVKCPLSADQKPFPRKEMIWAQWGLKDKLTADPDVLLCHQCGDCTAYCPRGAKPGDVLGAIRAYMYTHYGWPQGLAKLCSSGKNLPILIAIPAVIIGIVWLLSGGMHSPEAPIDFGQFFGEGHVMGLTKTVALIDLIFLPTVAFSLFAAYRGVSTLWNKMNANLGVETKFRPSVKQLLLQFFWPAIVEIVQHKRFEQCGENKGRVKGHLPLLLAFIGLFIVTNYAFVAKDIVGAYVPSMHGPISQINPVKILANVSAIALIIGIGILWSNRKQMEAEGKASPTFYDWFLIWEIMAVGITGLGSELSRLLGLGLPAYVLYYLHLISVMMLFLYMPYTKFAHMVYRTTALAFERYRESGFVKNA